MLGIGNVRPTTSRSLEPPLGKWQTALANDRGILFLVASAVVLLHIFTNHQYGFQRDELMTIDNARHLSWGYVEYPPATAFLARVGLELFGTSLVGFRFFAALAQGAVLALVGLATRELGGKRWAMLTAVFAVAIAGPVLFNGSFLSYETFDYLSWVLAAYLVIRLLNSQDPRWWVAIGAVIGLGMMTKYTMGVLVLGVVAGALLTPARRHLRSPWLWSGVAIAAAVWLPNLLWQIDHHFVTLEFVKSIHARDIAWGRTKGFLTDQLWNATNPVTVPLWGAGLWYVAANGTGKRLRMLGWMYVVPLLAYIITKGRGYYLAPAYPMLLAAGAVWLEQWAATLNAPTSWRMRRIVWRVFAVSGLMVAASTLPLAPINSGWWRWADRANGMFDFEIGWPDVAEAVAKVRDTLPAQERSRLGILAGDVGEAGAINLYGPAYGLPAAISGMNSYWQRGYGDHAPETVIVVGLHRDILDQNFKSCELVGHLTNRYGIVNGAIDGYTQIFLCRGLRQPWPDFWRHFQYFG